MNEADQLRQANARLEAAVQELKLEISYYKGETKRLEWEKDVLNTDVKRMSGLFKAWIDEAHRQSASITNDPSKINNMVKNPCKSISELLQLHDNLLFVTSSQPPHFIEYVSKKWSEGCGWLPSEVVGLTCSFLQGEMTSKEATKSFMNDIRSVGYAHMRVYNYKKSGQIFEVDVTVYPVFDSLCAVGPDSEVAVLTHFASVMTDIKDVSHSDHASSDSDTTGGDSSNDDDDRVRNTNKPNSRSSSSLKAQTGPIDRRNQAQRFTTRAPVSTENFLRFGDTLRLSNLLRLMLSSQDAMILTDNHGRILHVNPQWVELTGYELNDVEGQTNKILQDRETDMTIVAQAKVGLEAHKNVEMVLYNYRKDGTRFLNIMTIVPIIGGYLEQKVSHYAAVCREVVPDDSHCIVDPQRISIIERSSMKLLSSTGRSDSLSTEFATVAVASSYSDSNSDGDEQSSSSSSDKTKQSTWQRSSKSQLSRSIEEISVSHQQDSHDEGEEYHAGDGSSSSGSSIHRSSGHKKQRRHTSEDKDITAMDETA